MRFVVALILATAAAPAWAATPGVAGELEQSTTTSPKEKVDFTRGAIEEITGAVKTVEKLLEQAQKEKNSEHIECLTRKLTPLRALQEVSKVSNTTMQQALANNDAVHADQEFRKVAVALTKSRDFLSEAQGCVGDTGAQRGDASVAVVESGDPLVDSDSAFGDSPIEDTPIISPN